MTDFKKRVDEIYQPIVFPFIFITILVIIIVILGTEDGNIFMPLPIAGMIVWLYTVIGYVQTMVIRRKMFSLMKKNKMELLTYLVKRIHKERRKINILRRRNEISKEDLINELILDLKKDKITYKVN